MYRVYKQIIIALLCLLCVGTLSARQDKTKTKKVQPTGKDAAGCAAPSAANFLSINNVKSRVNSRGSMWTAPGETVPQYYVPANSTKTSLYSGSIWIAGLDINGQLKVSAQTFAQGNELNFWTGPLTVDGAASVDEVTCAKYDKQWVITKAEVALFKAWFNSEDRAGEFPNYQVPEVILNWPAHGNTSKKQAYYMAPFYDADGSESYNPLEGGDYPYYDFENSLCPPKEPDPSYVPTPAPGPIGEHRGLLVDQVLKGDQTIWWVMNDKGNRHQDPSGEPIGIEMRAQAFAFATNDEINNMTFFSYEIINRSTYTLTETFFAPWTDPDLGYAADDYVGCDVARGMGYCYNGNDVDGTGQVNAYGDQPPAIGIDFFQGPYMDPDNLDNPRYRKDTVAGAPVLTQIVDESINGVNFGNGIIDDERFGMRRFVYYNIGGSGVNGDPGRNSPSDFYNYLRGIWKNNARMQYGGDAYNDGAVGPDADFMFPGDSDPWNWGTAGQLPNDGYNQNGKYWTEEQSGNQPGDRRFIQSAGPFTLEPGAVNYITFGIPWARATSGGASASVDLLRVVDDKCQALFDNCFKIIDGPNAPIVTVVEMDKELILLLSDGKENISNNYNKSYNEVDPTIVKPSFFPPNLPFDNTYTFEGYQIYQLADADVSVTELKDVTKARLVAQCDIKNDVSKLINYNFDESIGATVPTLEVNGANGGIKNTFRITEDAFALGDKSLVNNKTYYFMAIAYAYNNYYPYSIDPANPNGLYGQKKPYLAGRMNATGGKIKSVPAIPHKNLGGLELKAKYGDIPAITRLEGKGNGGMPTKLSETTVDLIMSRPAADSNNRYGSDTYPIAYTPEYDRNNAPVNVSIIDPLNLKGTDFELRLDSLVQRYRTSLTNSAGLVIDNQHKITDTASMMVAKWHLKNLSDNSVITVDSTILTPTDYVMPQYGFTVNMDQVYEPGLYVVGQKATTGTDYADVRVVLSKSNGLISSTITAKGYSSTDDQKLWLAGLQDTDNLNYSDWIASGTGLNDAPYGKLQSIKIDPNSNYEQVVGGTWAPVWLSRKYSDGGPSLTDITLGKFGLIGREPIKTAMRYNLSSVQIVFTSDKSKWSRCPVLETQSNPALSQGNATIFALRASPSIDKDGNFAQPGSGSSTNPLDANYISDSGMGWFPGYAIDVETGERLNILYGEDSWLASDNGNDMQWNPTGNLLNPVSGKVVLGGKHFVYVMRSGHSEFLTEQLKYLKRDITFPAYDAGASVCNLWNEVLRTKPALASRAKVGFFKMFTWVTIPMLEKGRKLLETDVTIDINIAKPYSRYDIYDTTNCDMAAVQSVNNHYPLYRFSTKALAATTSHDETVIENALDQVRVVPNPYYAFSAYESQPLDNKVLITNLPKKCKISIYNLAGTQIRFFNKADGYTTVDWDLKNFSGIPIASGMYIIHIEADVNGKKYEQVVKWMGMMRKPDLNSF